ncbi:MAG: hypothetical protein U0228_10500 [Myxococcaceae bacterium]
MSTSTVLSLLERAERLASSGQPGAALVALDEALEAHGDDWRLWHLKAATHRQLGDLASAVATAEEGLARYGPKPHLVDLLFSYLARAGRGAEAVERWAELAPSFKAFTNPAANTLAHLVVCFISAGQRGQALEQLAPLFETARGTTQSRAGLMEFNAACLFALEGRVADATLWSARALELGYQPKEFADADFDGIRTDGLFSQFLAHVSGDRRGFELREAGARRVVVWTRPGELRRLEWNAGRLEAEVVEPAPDPLQLVEARRAWLEDCDAAGMAHATFDFVTPWRTALDVLFQSLARRDLEVSRLSLVWDYDPRVRGLEREYSLHAPVELEAFALLPQLPTRAALEEVFGSARTLASFGRVRWAREVEVTHEEHDAGVEFAVSVER